MISDLVIIDVFTINSWVKASFYNDLNSSLLHPKIFLVIYHQAKNPEVGLKRTY